MFLRSVILGAAMGLAQSAAAQPRLAAIDALVAQIVGETTPGLGVLVTRKGRVLHLAGYGLADIDAQTPVTADSIFNLASVSKQMTALAARMQIEAGLYREDTPVGAVLPAMGDQGGARAVTVGDLIHHLSGLPDYLSWEAYSDDMDNRDVLAWLARQQLNHDPGDFFDYSNSGYLALGSLIAAADGADDLSAVLAARVWSKAGMGDTGLPFATGRAVTGYAGTGGNFDISHAPDQAQGDGNVFSTLNDLAKYEAGFWDGRYLKDTSALFVNGRLESGRAIADGGAGYGYGWALSPDGRIADHSGGWDGTSTYYYRDLSGGVSIVLLANGEDADLWPLAEEIADLLQ